MNGKGLRLTEARRDMLEFIARGGERGRMMLQLVASGGREGARLNDLRNAGLVEYCGELNEPDRVRVTEAGRKALAK
jgi:hypothetical protein